MIRIRMSTVAAFAVAIISLATSAAVAVPIIYTETDIASGSLGGVSFTNANIEITVLADTSTAIVDIPGPPCCQQFENVGMGTLTVGGGTPMTFTDRVGVFSTGLEEGAVGFYDAQAIVSEPEILDARNPLFKTYDLTKPIGPVTSTVPFCSGGSSCPGIINLGPGYPTSGGALILSSAGAPTFTAATCSSIFTDKSVVFSGQGTTQAHISFTPSAAVPGLTLSAAEALCGVDTFNWQQLLTVPVPVSIDVCLDSDCLSVDRQSGTVFDPTQFGSPYCNPNSRAYLRSQIDCSQSYPFYYSLTAAEKAPAIYCVAFLRDGSCGDDLNDFDRVLNFYDAPANTALSGLMSCTASSPLAFGFTTKLVGITAQANIEDEYAFDWCDTYNQTSGGINTTINDLQVDTGGTGGITLLKINGVAVDVPVGVPEPATLALFGAGLAGLGALRRRRKARSETDSLDSAWRWRIA